MECARGRTSLLASRISACTPRDRVCLREHGLVALLSDAVAGRIARRCHAPLLQVAFIRRVRLRLGMGRRLSPSWSLVLSQIARGDPVFAGHRPPSARARRGDPGPPRSRRTAALAGGFLPACAVSGRVRSTRDGGRWNDAAPLGPVSLAKPRLRGFRRVSLRSRFRETQEDPTGETTGAGSGRASATAGRGRNPRRELELFHALLQQHVSGASLDAVSEPGVLPAPRRDASRAPPHGARRARWKADRERPQYLFAGSALRPLLGLGHACPAAAFRGLLLPSPGFLHRTRDPDLRRRRARRTQARARLHAEPHVVCALAAPSGILGRGGEISCQGIAGNRALRGRAQRTKPVPGKELEAPTCSWAGRRAARRLAAVPAG